MMYQYKHDIHVDRRQKSYGIDPHTLKKGNGRITRLYLYEEKSSFEGNPFAPSMSLKRTIHAEFEDGWKILNPTYMSFIEELVSFIDRRYSFKIIK